jgi:hypothetical protein
MDRFKEFIDDKSVRKLLLVALVPFGLCVVAYFIRFGLFMKLPISSNQGDWGTFGDFVGGVLNPIYAFLAFAGVVYTVLLQKDQIEIMKTQQKLDELQQLLLGVSSSIDKVLYEQKHKYRDVDTPVFNLLMAISNDSARLELDPSLPIRYVYRDTRESILNLISYNLVYIEEQLSHMVWCLQTYNNNKGSKDIEEFYVGKYRNTVFMMKQMEYLHLKDVEDFFRADEVKKEVFEAIRAEQPNL